VNPYGIHVIKNFPIEINRRAALRHLGYKPSSKIDDRIKNMIDTAFTRAVEMAEPRGLYFTDKIAEHTEGEVVLDCGFRIRSKQVSRLLKACVEMVVFAATIGPDAETEAAKLMDKKPAEAVILDAAAGEATEGAVEYIHRSVQSDAHRRGLHLTPRFSPGYGDWSLEAQRELFPHLKPEKIGITLNQSCMMIPRKSVSGIVGLGPLPGIRTGASPCKECSKNIKSEN